MTTMKHKEIKMRHSIPMLAALTLATFLSALALPVTAAADDTSVSLNGAGASFPFPLYSKWVSEYNKLNPNIKINYQSIGSGGGIKQFSERTVDFGGTDAFMKDDAIAKLGVKIHHIPTTLGAVVVVYNAAGVQAGLKLTPEVLSGIFLGEIKLWNDPKIASLNPGAKLPADEIKVVHRSDGSGTTAVFTEYLSKVSPAWKDKVGTGTSVNWPAGLGAKGNEGVTGQVKTTPGSIGYVELAYAVQLKLPFASLRNKAGEFVEPKMDSISAAAAGVQIPADYRVSLSDAPGKASYPIASFTWILVYEEQADRTKGLALAKFLWWALHDGQKFGADLNYAPLPAGVIEKVEGTLKTLKNNGAPLLGK
jgi:phosphate transport system substrate-binding protein